MFRILIFDTETGGFDPKSSDLLQISYQVVDADTWNVLKVVDHFFDWTSDERVNAGAVAVNGLSKEYLSTVECSDRYEAMKEFLADVESCVGVVGHNVQFDMNFINYTCEDCGLAIPEWPHAYDTMNLTIDHCQLPNRNPSRTDRYKRPKLSELAMVLDITMDDLRLHHSSADVELTFRCFRKLCDRGIIEL